MPDRATGPRRRLTYANVASTIALFLAVGGGSAYAVSHYVITSTGQIKPSVLKQLKGARGPKGVTGPRGPKGLKGAPGLPNPDATTVDGQTVTKVFQNDAPNSSVKQLFNGDELTLSYYCNAQGYPVLEAASTASAPLLEFAGSFNGTFKSGETSDTNSFSGFHLLGGVSDDYGTLHFSYGDTDGHVVSGVLAYWSTNAFNTSTNCALFGTLWSS
jgi:hypothetical protein